MSTTTTSANNAASTTTTTTRCGIYPCNHHLGSGHVYIGTSAMSFVHASHHQRIGPIEYCDMVDVVDTGDGGICITTVSGEEWVFDSFGSTAQKDTVYTTLQQATSRANANVKDEETTTVSQEFKLYEKSTRRGLVRSSSLPSFTKDHDGIEPVVVKEEDEIDNDPLQAGLADLGNASFVIRQQLRQEHEEEKKEQESAAATVPRRRDLRRESVTKSMRLLSMASQQKSPAEWKEAWIKLQKDPKISQVAIQPTQLPISFDSFYKTFWSSKALHPISVYQKEEVGDEDIETLEWSSGGDNDSSLCRSIEYMHPSTAPMGPPMAKTTKKQVLQTFGHEGIVLQTTTEVQDVPMADCFILEDRILVEPHNEKGITLTCLINVKFVKSTMWKKIIASNAKKGITEWMEGYVEYIRKAAESSGGLGSIKE